MLAWPRRRTPALLRDALALTCLLLVFQLAMDLPPMAVPAAVPLLGATLVLVALKLGRASALFAALVLAVVARAQLGPISGFGLRVMELLMMLAIGLGGAALVERMRHYRHEVERAYRRMDCSVRAAGERTNELRWRLAAAEARLNAVRIQTRGAHIAEDPMEAAFRSEGGV